MLQYGRSAKTNLMYFEMKDFCVIFDQSFLKKIVGFEKDLFVKVKLTSERIFTFKNIQMHSMLWQSLFIFNGPS